VTDPLKLSTVFLTGAGDGRVTEKMASHFDQVFATEASKPMVWRLQELGYR
jgi:16S rRNA A1518/A1519 N6-dimethyltransferase RsmA/KsgA/DIM1 with predicted DNA glycosylase/AP lyase activity